MPGVIEVRRPEGGIRAWDAQTGEYYHALDGAYGGLWRRNGGPPQQLAAVGFSAQGTFEGSYYRRQPGAADPRAARLLRADMTYAELPGGGAVFAAGSITFCGSLSHDRYDNAVSRILENVLDRFRARR